jgi:hypothetical protein
MKPWQLPLDKTPNKRGKKGTKIKDPSLNQVKEKNPKWVTKWQRNNNFQSPHQSQKHIKNKKGQ